MTRSAVVVPARFDSTRLPGKPLADLGGMPMIVRVLERLAAVDADPLVAAVDDPRVADAVSAAGYRAIMTDPGHESGSDRVMEAVSKIGLEDEDVVINVQGDEPLIPSDVVEQLSAFMVAHPKSELATLSEDLSEPSQFDDPNVVKVVSRLDGRALYFSRAKVPFPRDVQTERHLHAKRHIGIYAFRVRSLRAFTELSPSPLERIERLEQLRWLDNGGSIDVLTACAAVPGGVDTPEDLERVRRLLS